MEVAVSKINAEEIAQKFHEETRTWAEMLNRTPPPPWESIQHFDLVVLTRAAENALLPIVQEYKTKIEKVESEIDATSDLESDVDDLHAAIQQAVTEVDRVSDDLKEADLILKAHPEYLGGDDLKRLSELVGMMSGNLEEASDELNEANESG